MHSSGSMTSSRFVSWMQSTGQTAMQDLSLMSMQPEVMTYVMGLLGSSRAELGRSSQGVPRRVGKAPVDESIDVPTPVFREDGRRLVTRQARAHVSNLRKDAFACVECRLQGGAVAGLRGERGLHEAAGSASR